MIKTTSAEVTRWQGSQHPTTSLITRMMEKEGMRAYAWNGTPNKQFPTTSNNFHRILYIVAGSLEVNLPDENHRYTLKTGDRLIVPAGIRYSLIVGPQGADCLEAAVKRI
jgi:hypothetical protein